MVNSLTFLTVKVTRFNFGKQLTNDRKKQLTANSSYMQAGVSYFVGQQSAKFKVVGSLVLKIPVCV